MAKHRSGIPMGIATAAALVLLSAPALAANPHPDKDNNAGGNGNGNKHEQPAPAPEDTSTTPPPDTSPSQPVVPITPGSSDGSSTEVPDSSEVGFPSSDVSDPPKHATKPSKSNSGGSKAPKSTKSNIDGEKGSGPGGNGSNENSNAGGRAKPNKGHDGSDGPGKSGTAGNKEKKERPATASRGKGRKLGHSQSGRRDGSGKKDETSGTTIEEVLGLRFSSSPGSLPKMRSRTNVLSAGLSSNSDSLPLTGGDLAAFAFVGLMVVTVGGLIWRAPSLIDKGDPLG